MLGKIKNKELDALIRLLDEPDYYIFDKVQDKIYSYGTEAIPVLENAWENSFDNDIQQRIESIIHKLQFDDLKEELLIWSKSGGKDLLKGFALLTQHQYPDLDLQYVQKQINKITQDVWLELNNNLTSLEKIKVINHILYDVHGYSANKTNIHAPQNSYINNVLETKKGNPLSLGMIYIIVSQMLDMPVFGVNLPQHFVLAYTSELLEGGKKIANKEDVLFYINPFNKGTVFTRREIELFIKQLNLKPRRTFYHPCSNKNILIRLLDNLRYGYEKSGYPEKLLEIDELLDVLKK